MNLVLNWMPIICLKRRLSINHTYKSMHFISLWLLYWIICTKYWNRNILHNSVFSMNSFHRYKEKVLLNWKFQCSHFLNTFADEFNIMLEYFFFQKMNRTINKYYYYFVYYLFLNKHTKIIVEIDYLSQISGSID